MTARPYYPPPRCDCEHDGDRHAPDCAHVPKRSDEAATREIADAGCRQCYGTGLVWRPSRTAPYSLTALSGRSMVTEPCACQRRAAMEEGR